MLAATTARTSRTKRTTGFFDVGGQHLPAALRQARALVEFARAALRRWATHLARSAQAIGTPRKVRTPLQSARADRVAADGRRRRGASSAEGDGRARRAAAVLVVEAMKMHHEVVAPAAGVVRELAVAVGDQVAEGQALFRRRGRATAARRRRARRAADGERGRRRRGPPGPRRGAGAPAAPADDAARPAAVERRHASGLRTARENVADLCDPGSFSEYGGLTLAAQRARRTVEELIEKTPGDGIVTGIGASTATRSAASARCVVLAYDYTVLAGTQGIRNHRKTDRLLELAERQRLPVVLFAEGGGGRPGDTDSLRAVPPRRADASNVRAASRPRAAGRDRLRPLLRRQRRAARLLRRRDRDAGGEHRDGRPGDDRGRRARLLRARGGRPGRRCRSPTA